MNILESWVRLSDYRVPLVGGQAACVFVQIGRTDVVITSTIPFDPKSKNEEACKSQTMNLQLVANETRHFLISPATKGSTYVCGWRVEPLPASRGAAKDSP